MSTISDTHQEIGVTLYCHPNYDTETIDNDICLLKLDTPVIYNDNIQPVCLGVTDQEVEVYPEGSCYVMGWGALEYGGQYNQNKNNNVILLIITILLAAPT